MNDAIGRKNRGGRDLLKGLISPPTASEVVEDLNGLMQLKDHMHESGGYDGEAYEWGGVTTFICTSVRSSTL